LKTPLPRRPKHKLGQNFLTDSNVIDKISSFFSPTEADHVVEIGAGTGALTSRLAPLVDRLIAVEIDPLLIPALEGLDGVETIHQDILKTDLHSLVADRKLRIIGNLPYYISTAVVLHLAQQRDALQDMLLMFQDEVARRIVSPPSRPDYSYLSVVSQYFCVIELGFRISRNCFYPKPQVESRVLRFGFKSDLPLSFEEYTTFVGHAFSQRRKMLRNNLMRTIHREADQIDRAFEYIGIDPAARAENLTPSQFEALILELR
jgi:16S rRNA (adenine1518-N6/adenine1519-N6)-dimethyltransferase